MDSMIKIKNISPMERVLALPNSAIMLLSQKIKDRMETPAINKISAISSRRNKYCFVNSCLKCFRFFDLNTSQVIKPAKKIFPKIITGRSVSFTPESFKENHIGHFPQIFTGSRDPVTKWPLFEPCPCSIQ